MTSSVKRDARPFVAAIERFMLENELSKLQFSEKIYGRDKNNRVNTSAYAFINGDRVPSLHTITRIKLATGLDLSDVPRQPAEPQALTTTVRSIVQAYEQNHHHRSGTVTTLEVSLTARLPDGSVMLALQDVSADQVVRVLNALIASGVIR